MEVFRKFLVFYSTFRNSLKKKKQKKELIAGLFLAEFLKGKSMHLGILTHPQRTYRRRNEKEK